MNQNINQNEIDEALEIIWTLEEKGVKNSEKFKEEYSKEMAKKDNLHLKNSYENIKDEILEELKSRELVEIKDGKLILSNKGHEKARNIVRRHRLAERLMVDVLDMGKEEVEKPACEFEHLLSKEVTSRICTLLGHPEECPHGLPIPGGSCCETEKKTISPTVIPLTKANIGETVKVAYIQTESHSRIHKLLSYDVGPGTEIKVHQKNPTYVIRVGETDIAFERDVVEDIYVKTINNIE